MPSRNIILSAGHYYHIYNKAVSDNLLFIEERNYHFFLSKILLYLGSTTKLLAYCLLPNHYHLLIQLKEHNLPKSMQKLALSYTVPFNRIYNRTGHLFQGPYRLKSVDDTRYLVHLSRYIHLNPVAAKLVNKSEDWNFSSMREYVGMRSSIYIDPRIVLDIMDDKAGSSLVDKQRDYKNFVEDWDPDYMSFTQK